MKEFLQSHIYGVIAVSILMGIWIGWTLSAYLIKDPERRQAIVSRMKVVKIIIPIMLIFSQPLFAQRKPKPATIPQMADEVPNIKFKDPYGEYFNLNDIGSKMVIIDFWASWCGSCIAQWPHSDSLQEKYGDDISFLFVSFKEAERGEEDSAAMKKLWKWESKITHIKYFAMDDTAAYDFFNPYSLPHYVWLRREDKGKGPRYYITGTTSGSMSLDEMLRYAYSDKK